MGAMMGTGVGLTIGFIFGSYSILRYVSGTKCSAYAHARHAGEAQAHEEYSQHYHSTC